MVIIKILVDFISMVLPHTQLKKATIQVSHIHANYPERKTLLYYYAHSHCATSGVQSNMYYFRSLLTLSLPLPL